MIPFVQAKFFTPVASRRITLIVMHAMEEPEKPTTAEAVASYFAHTVARPSSAHYCCDDDSIVQCVRDHDVAYGAPGANHNGLHIEQAGFSAQLAAGWADAYSSVMLREQVGPLVRAKAWENHIPLSFVNAAGLIAGDHGVTTHAEVTKAFHRSTHTDPGPNYPMGSMLNIARRLPRGEWDEMATKEEIEELFELWSVRTIQALSGRGNQLTTKRAADLAGLPTLASIESQLPEPPAP
jgi:N-acetylmuramoyl-L-alanine amidase